MPDAWCVRTEASMTYKEWVEAVPSAIRDDPVWRVEVTEHRMELLTRIIKSLLTIIPNERGYKMREDESPYSADLSHLLDNPPMSDAEQPHVPRTTHHVSSSHAPRTTHHALES